jgi:hypothetical protein
VSVSERYSRGEEFLLQDNIASAREEFNILIENHPDSAFGFFGLGSLYAIQGHKEKAVEEWLKCVEIQSAFGRAYYALAWAYYDAGDSQRGYEYTKLAIDTGVKLDAVQDLLDKILSIEELVVSERRDYNEIINFKILRAPLFIFSLAFIIRLVYLYFVVPVDWVGDSYHHWQIAWYTLKIGLSHGRLWDLKGVEYYWPPLPSLFEAFLLWLFRSSSIFFMRFANIIVGSCSVVVSYFIGRRFSERIGKTIATALLFFPFTLNYEVLALHEPMMILFGLIGIYMFLDKKDFFSGLFLGFSYLCHFTVYIIAPIILLLYLWRERIFERILPFLIGFGVIYLPYVYILLTHTGDALYNIHTLMLFMGISTAHMRNPLANILGPALLILGLISLVFVYYKIHDRITIVLVTLFGGYSLLWGFILTFVGAPLSPYEIRYYGFIFILGVFISGLVIDRIPILQNYYKFQGLEISRSMIFVGALSLIFLISFIPTYSRLETAITDGYIVADKLGEYYIEGTIISPVPHMTYRLTNKYDIKPQNILGPIYAPTEHEAKMTWLQNHNVTLFFWLPGFEADRVFPELSEGRDSPPFYILDVLPFSRFIYEVKWD